MRRQNPLSVRVKAPSRGVVSRLPGKTCDTFITGTDKFSGLGLAKRTSTIGSNVRYDDGVVRNAAGYDRITLFASILDDLVVHWRLDESLGTRFDATQAHRDLSEVLGDFPSFDRIGQVPGKFKSGAEFTSVPFIPPTCSQEGEITTSLGDWGPSVNTFQLNGPVNSITIHGASILFRSPTPVTWRMLMPNPPIALTGSPIATLDGNPVAFYFDGVTWRFVANGINLDEFIFTTDQCDDAEFIFSAETTIARNNTEFGIYIYN